MEYSLLILSTAKRDLDVLDPVWRERVLSRLEWLAKNADQVAHHRLQGLPEQLSALFRFRVADYRVLYWKDDEKKVLKVFRVRHRSQVYRKL